MLWSYSRLTAFEDCPYRYYLRYIAEAGKTDKFYAEYGTLMHSMISEYLTDYDVTEDDIVDDYIYDFYDMLDRVEGIPSYRKTILSYYNDGLSYLSDIQLPDGKVKDVERRFFFPVEGEQFQGIIDLLLKQNDGGYVIVDHKSRKLKPRSSRGKPTLNDKEIDEKKRQLYLYSAAVKNEYGECPTALYLNCFRVPLLIKESFDFDKYNEAVKWAKRTIESISEASIEDFKPRIDQFKCTYICSVSESCEYYKDFVEGGRRNM